MKKITFGKPEEFVPSKFCDNLNYMETAVKYDTSKIKMKHTPKGVVVELPLEPDEQIYGFGLQLKSFNHTGYKLTLRVNSDPAANTGDTHAPVPFFVTNKGYGIYFDTARYIEAYCGFTKKQRRENADNTDIAIDTDELYKKRENREEKYMTVLIPSAEGIDLYLFEGENITDVVSQYNMFSGGGCDVPEWGLGVMYRCFGRSNSKDIRAFADYFRTAEIPCDILGFEPGWQSGSYPCTFLWDNERFPDYKELIDELKAKGFHINLWEHAYIAPQSPLYGKMFDYSGDYEVWKGLVPDFASDGAKIFSDYHREKLVNLGIDGFKLDECDNSDFREDWGFPNCSEFPSGADGEQYHSLFGALYMKAILKALGKVKTLSEVRSAGALCAGYPFVLYSDLYDRKDFLRALVNSGFSGLLWAPEMREAYSEKELMGRLWNVIFSPQCVINGWYYEEVPWKGFNLENEVRKALTERHKLIPRLKKAFEVYHSTGVPPVRALVMDFTDDEETWNIDDEYMFCDNLLVAPFTADETERKVYLPNGEWKDYWSDEVFSGGWIMGKGDIPVYEKIK